ncbi:cation:proton antiporter [Streptomyces sp. NPDC048172]|uniref:cation:proton antiporter domain-containing protein n=1 Tax=Streptomyces sp. NPDC048172 TaxID=3365505 RepID=UPI00371C46EA
MIVCGVAVILLWTFAARRLLGWHVSGPVVMVAGGIAAGFVFDDEIGNHLNTDLAERLVQLILALLLFVDAIEVRGGFLAGERRTAARLLFLALPLTLVAAFVLGLPLLGVSSWAVVLAVACVVMPVDFAPAADLLRDERLPRGLRHVLAVESGYNDGFFSPVFAFALLLVDASGETADPLSALGHAVPAFVDAVLVGVGIGAVTGFVLRLSAAARWTDVSAVRIALVLVPLLTYAIATAVGGNGFVAAFLAGLAYKLDRRGRQGLHTEIQDGPREGPAHAELAAVDSLTAIASMIMWFVFGGVAVLVFELGFQRDWILYGLLALTVARLLPVHVAMLRSRTTWGERTLLGALGPRGTSSIVFGLLAFNAMGDSDAATVLYVMTVVIIGSMLLHGLATPLALRRFSGPGRRSAPSHPARRSPGG